MAAVEGGTIYALDQSRDDARSNKLLVGAFVVDLAIGALVLLAHYESPR